MLVRVAKRGLGLLGMSQRPASVKKNYITQADWLVWHRLTWSNDTKVVRRVLGSEYEDAVEGPGDGEAFFQADFTESAVRRVQFRWKETFDAGATPSLDDVDRPELKSISDDSSTSSKRSARPPIVARTSPRPRHRRTRR